MVQWWAPVSAQCRDYPICKTKTCWHSIDIDFDDGVTLMPCTALPEKAATTLYMNCCHNVTLWLHRMQDQKLLMLRWRSFSGLGGHRPLLFLPLKEANTSIMHVCNKSPPRLPTMQSQESLMLPWHSFETAAVNVSLSDLPRQAPNMLVMHNSDQITFNYLT